MYVCFNILSVTLKASHRYSVYLLNSYELSIEYEIFQIFLLTKKVINIKFILIITQLCCLLIQIITILLLLLVL